MKRYLISLVMVTFAAFSSIASPSILESTRSRECNQWVDSVFRTLTLEQRVAQLFIPIINPHGGTSTDALVRTFMGKYEMGGYILSEGSLKECAHVVELARKESKIMPLVTIDGEWGLSMRVPTTPRFPHNMGLGAIRDYKLLYEYGNEVGREMRLLGVNVNFAPVLDVNVNPSNPVISYRSFGEMPLEVAEAGAAYARGLEAAGILSCGKHFPGHGDTNVDSHKALPTVNHSITQLQEVDLVPFEKYIADGGSAIMTAHLNVPSIDGSGTPASLSKKVTTDLLRKKMGFKGLIFTDALGMKGAKSSENNCIKALLAGADVLVGPMSPVSDLKAVVAAVKSGKIKESEINERCRRLLAFKFALGLADPKPLNLTTLAADISSPRAKAINQALANASITLLRDSKNLVPIGKLASNSIAIVNIGGEGNDFSNLCEKYAGVDVYHSTVSIAEIKKHDIVVAAVYSDNQAARNQLTQLKNVAGLIEVFFINPYKMAKFKVSIPESASVLLAYDNTPATQSAAAQALFGGISINGQLPVTLNGIAAAGTGLVRLKSRLGYSSPIAEGMNPSLIDRVDSIIQVALDTKAIPGCQILVARNGNVVIDKSYGKQSMDGTLKVDDNTLYDLASVSKATGTLPGVMKAYDLGLFKLDEKASKYIPGLKGTDKEDIKIIELLYHESGIQPSLNMFDVIFDTTSFTGKLITPKRTPTNTLQFQRRAFGNPSAKVRRDITSSVKSEKFPIRAGKDLYVGPLTYDTVMSRIYTSQLRKDKSYAYSCLNFCLLMNLEELVTGINHDKFVNDSIFAPLGANYAGYRPRERFSLNQIASTEYDPFLRKETVCGMVHDELANLSGGVQGNAGLFSNAGDLAKICQMWLNGGVYGDSRVLSENTVKLFTTSKSPTCRRGLGFDKPDMENPENSPTCEEARASTYGHLGFTGTVFWVDPENQLIFIFLNNRVNPTRDNDAFSAMNLRPDLFKFVYQSLE